MTLDHPDPLLTDKEAAAILGMSRTTFWRRINEGKVQKPMKLGGLSRWTRSEIMEIRERANAARLAA